MIRKISLVIVSTFLMFSSLNAAEAPQAAPSRSGCSRPGACEPRHGARGPEEGSGTGHGEPLRREQFQARLRAFPCGRQPGFRRCHQQG